jgi:S-phase kinase-associated protein 1
MTDEIEVKGLELSLDDHIGDCNDFYKNGFQQELLKIFKDFGIIMPKIIVNVIHAYCAPGITFVVTHDGQDFAVNTKALGLSTLLNIQAEKNQHTIRVHNISGDIFSHISTYLNHHNGVKPAEIAKPIISVNMTRIVEDEWDAVFADNMTKREIFQIILAANYIDCKSLLNLMCAKLATLIKGKSPEGIRRILTEEDDQAEEINEIVQNQVQAEENDYNPELNNKPVQAEQEPLTLEDLNAPTEDIPLEPLTLEDIEAPTEENANHGELEFKDEHLADGNG